MPPRHLARLWLLEDSTTEAEATTRALLPTSTVERFTDGAGLVEALTQRPPPDVLVLDWYLPGMSGLEVCQYLRSRPEYEGLPVLLLTSNRSPEDIALGLAAGANDFVSKPFLPIELRARVEALLRTGELRARLVRAETARRERAEGELAEAHVLQGLLREREARFRHLAENIPDIITRFDRQYRHLYVNRAVTRATGRPPEDFLGRTNAELGMAPQLVALWHRAIDAAFAGREEELTFSFAAPDGERHFQARLVLEEAAAGSGPQSVLVITRDVTQLVHARQQEERRARFAQQLLGIVSHDLRSPLQAIRLSAVMLAGRGGRPGAAERAVERVRASAERATLLVEDLLDLTQAQLSGSLPVRRTPGDLHAIVQASVEEARAVHPRRQVRLHREGDAHGAWDAHRMGQVAGNLLANALAYSAEDDVVEAGTRGEGDTVVLWVHNRGEPIPSELRARLFQPLERGKAVPTGGRSVGLGLFIVNQIVRAHGGNVEVHSTEADGTTFRVHLPRGPA